ncbi:MAG: aspartyl protease family protein, partial [Bythopirellula sp.]
MKCTFSVVALALLLIAKATPAQAQQVPLGGFIPFVGIGLTDEFKDAGTDLTGAFFLADQELFMVGDPLSGTGSPYYDIALLDTGAATHILTAQASGTSGFDIDGNDFDGTNIQQIGGATGLINLEINDPLAIYAAGLGDRTSAGASLQMDSSALRGQSSVATLSAPTQWALPNILGLPMAAHHAIHIKNSEPQLFEFNQRTVRTPQVDFFDLGTGDQQGILRRTDLKIRPGSSFIAGPLYIQNLDIFGGNFDFHENPLSPTIIENGAMFIDVDLANGAKSLQDKELLFDTGADLTVVSELTAARLGFDPVLDEPDFVLEVEGSGGVSSGIPGFYLDELNIDTVGGSFTMANVPIAVLDVTNPNDPGNTIDGILGMHLFTGRDLVIDINPSIGQGGSGPSLYISDPVTEAHAWSSNATSANWATPSSWSAAGTPTNMWVASVSNPAGSPQSANVSADSTVFQLIVSGNATNAMTVDIASGSTLTS